MKNNNTERYFNKNCPICNKMQIYNSKKGLYIAIKKNVKCNSCKRMGISPWNKGIQMSEEFKIKCSKRQKGKVKPWNDGLKMSNEFRNKCKERQIGKKYSDITKQKLRILAIERMKNQKVIAAYNPKACCFIEELNQKLGVNLKHALNGGEEIISGYYLDGYDKEKNIVFEYDESHHYSLRKRQKDLNRQNILIDVLKPKMFLRYNEIDKELVDIISNSKINL